MQEQEYAGLVAEARRLTKRSEEAQWRLAEMSWTVVHGGTPLADWAKDIELSEGRVSNYIKTWDRYADPASRNRSWTFNDHSEVARLADDKAQAIIAKAEADGISIGIARKRLSQEASHRARFEAERDADLDAALADTGNQVEGHRQAVEVQRGRIIEDRARQGAREATKPFIAGALATRVMFIPAKAADLREAIAQANEYDVEIDRLPQVIADLEGALIEARVHAAKHSIDLEVGP